MIDDGPNENENEIELEQSPQLHKEGIVNRFVFYRKTSSVQVLLNHQYESKSIVSSIDIHNWNNTHDVFEKTLKRRGVNKQHIPLLADVLDENYHVFISQDDNAGGEQQQEEPNESAAQIALRLAGEQCSSLFLDQFGTPYAAIEVDEHIETLPLKSSRFRNWLCKIFYSNSEGKILTSDNVTNVLSVLKARAEFDSHDTRALNSRVASRSEEPNTIFYDLTNKNWEYVKITSEGWRIEQSSKITPILFNRRASQQPQVYPAPASDDMYDTDDIFHIFMKLVNVKGEDNKLLLKCYIISLFYPDIPKPVLMLHGEQGSAKSTLQELIRVLVDPSSILTLTFPRDINELVQKLSHNYVAYFDNVSSIPDWISDQLCRAVTGSGFSKRELYTDDEDIIYNFKRCIGFNGINLGATKADLLDRGLIIELEKIAKANQRRIEEIWAEFNALKAKLLAYIFDTLVKVLQVKARGGIAHELKELPRMTDFAEIGEIISRCMGHAKGEFINAYYRNIELQTEEAIAANIVGNAIIQFMEQQDKAEWEGTATDLHMELEAKAAVLGINVKDKSWPKSSNTLGRKLNQIKTNLREIGIVLEKVRKKSSRGLKIRKISSLSYIPSLQSEPTEAENQAQKQPTDDISHDTNDMYNMYDNLHTLQGTYSDYPPICYYCDYKPYSKDDYEHHVVLKHPGKPAYPNKAEIEKQGLKPQGKEWER